MRIFLYTSILLILSFAGAVNASGPGKNGPGPQDSALVIPPVFPADFEKGLYRSVLDISSHHLTGFAFIKKTSDTTYRILFSNEFGMQFFDFEFGPENFTVHSCFPSLNRKSLLKLLENDLRIILFPLYGIKKISEKKTENKQEHLLKVSSVTGKWFFMTTGSPGRISAIKSSGKLFSKTRIMIVHTDELVSGIDISNPVIKLHFTMEQISR